MADSPAEINLATVIAEMQKTNASVAIMFERVNQVIEGQTVATEHLQRLSDGFEQMRVQHSELSKRQDAADERLKTALAKLQKSSGSADSAPSLKKTRINEDGHSRDASPTASGAPTPRTASSGMPSGVTFARPPERSSRSGARRASSAPPGGKDEVVLLKFAAPHTSQFARRWFDDIVRSLSEPLPGYQVRILSFHDYITPIFDSTDEADEAGRVLHVARPSLAIPGKIEVEKVAVIRDSPPPIRRRNLGLQVVWDAVKAACLRGKEPRPIHRARGAHPHSVYHIVAAATDKSRVVLTVQWADDGETFSITGLHVEPDAPPSIRAALVVPSPAQAQPTSVAAPPSQEVMGATADGDGDSAMPVAPGGV